MNRDFKVSVIVASYNSGDYIQQCLNSLLSQTLTDLEIVVVTDGSSDQNELLFLDRVQKDYDNVFVYHNEKNSGTGYTRQQGIKFSRGEYIGFLDTDDYVVDSCFETMYQTAKLNDSDIVVSDFYNVSDKGHIYNENDINSDSRIIVSGPQLFERQIRRYKAPYYLRVDWWNKIYRRKLFVENKVKLPEVVRNEGTMSMFMSLLADKVTILDSKLFYTVARSGSVCRTFREKNITDIKTSTLHFIKSVESLNLLERYYNDIVRFFIFVLFNHNLQLIIRLSKDDRELMLSSLLNEIDSPDVSSLFKSYLEYGDKRIERKVLASLLGKRRWSELKDIKGTDFFTRKEGGIRLSDRAKLKNPDLVSVVTIVKDLKSSGRISVFKKMLETVQRQTYGTGNIEHIVIDANSTDGTQKFLAQLASEAKIDYWLSEPDTGIYNAMNKGANVACGQYIAYMNSDDYFSPDAIAKLVESIKSNDSDYAFANARKVDDSDKLVGSHIGNMDKVFFGTPYCHQTLLVKRECFEKAPFDESYRITMWAYSLNLLVKGYKSSHVDEYLAFFRVGGVSTNATHELAFKAEQDKIKSDIIVPKLNIDFDEYEYLNHTFRKWPTESFDVNLSDLFNKIVSMELSNDWFKREFAGAVMNLVEFELNKDSKPISLKSKL